MDHDDQTREQRAPGRPSRLTPQAIDIFLQATRAGAPPEVAARHAGFSPASMYRYFRSTAPDHVAFRAEFLAARSALEVRLSGTIVEAALDDPKWALIWLERNSDAWRPRDRSSTQPHDAPGAQPSVDQPIVVLAADQIADLVPKLLEAGRRSRAIRAVGPAYSDLADETDR